MSTPGKHDYNNIHTLYAHLIYICIYIIYLKLKAIMKVIQLGEGGS